MSSGEDVYTVTGVVDDHGKFHVDEGQEKDFRWLFLRHAGYRIVLAVKRWRDKASKKQRGYLWAVVYPAMLKEMGFDNNAENRDDLHDTMKAKFAIKPYVREDGQVLDIIRGTSRMDTKEMHEFIENVIGFAQIFLNITIPPPQRVVSFDGGGI